MRKLAQKALLLCASLAVSLLIAEIVIRLVSPQDLSGSWGEQTERGLVVNKSSGVARHQFGGRVVYYSFTAPHLRAPAPDASVKVLVLGDSYAFGYLLGDRDTPVSLLQARLDEKFGAGVFSLLNAAVGGWGAGDYTAFVEDFGEQISPDVILVFLNTDDIGRALQSPLWDFSPADGKLSRAVPPRRRFKVLLNDLPGYQWLLEHSHLVQLLRNESESLRRKNSGAGQRPQSLGPGSEQNAEAARRGKALGAALFRRLGEWCRGRNVKLLVTTTGWHKPPYADSTEPTRAFMSGARTLFSELSVPFQDPSGDLRARMDGDADKYIIQGDGHPNEAGAALIAEYVFPFVEAQLGDYCRRTTKCTGQPAR
ncbi:MAG TPA: SGNH/GDSL hydrolase family protein [Pyrinomonadaceae bacterium]|nr:SGNH/GDSL hydrolase family protein [Pyrinomonadaceae bacterium]